MSATITTITQTNSTTYADEVGVLIGLSRLPGETSESYVKRLKTATRVDTSQDYIGLLNELIIQLGLNITQSIQLVSLSSNPLTVNVNLAGIVLTDTVLTDVTQTIPVVTVDIDNAWTWTLLSNIVDEINTGTVATATLIVADAPSMTVASQSNVLTVIAQSISGQNVNLGYDDVVVGSEIFNVPVPTYTLTSAGILTFTSPVPAGTQITYQRLIWPYTIITGDVAILSLLDPAVGQMAQGSNGTIVYQVEEAVQAIAAQDQSYWGA